MQHSEKAELREVMQSQRQALSIPTRRNQDQQLFEHLIRLPSTISSKILLITLSFNGECDTWSFAKWVIDKKGFVVLPRVDVEKRSLKLYRVDNLEHQLEPGYRGVQEPLMSCPEVDVSEIEWLLLPGLAFDRYGGRLGYGGGYFDRLLSEISPAAFRIGLGYRFQLLSQLPLEPHDQCIDTVVLPTGPLQTRHLLTGF